MNQTKQNRHDAIRARLESALRDLYHNATVTYPRGVAENRQDLFESWFSDIAREEIAYIAGGGAYASESKYRAILESNAAKLTSEAARKYYVRKGMRDMHRERSRCNQLDSRHNAVNAQWERICKFGKLYTYGRGGRTLAPSDLMTSGAYANIRADYFDEQSIESCVDAIAILESFNRHVESWCASVPELWREYFGETLQYERRERKQERAKVKEIARNKRMARDAFAMLAQF